MRILNTTLLLLAGVLFCSNQAFTEENLNSIEALTRCEKDSDCAIAPDVWSGCHHYCGAFKSDRCDENTRTCPAYRKDLNTSISCYVSNPCTKPKRVWCEHGTCQTE